MGKFSYYKQRLRQVFRIKMASGNDMTELSSGSDAITMADDTRITCVPTCHTGFMKAKLIDYLSDATDFSVDIWHTYNNDAQLVFNFLSQPGKCYMRYIAHGGGGGGGGRGGLVVEVLDSGTKYV